jgi:CRP-like cAMP-binding protein
MVHPSPLSVRLLLDGTPVHNHLLLGLPDADYGRIALTLRAQRIRHGETLQEFGTPISTVYFPNGGVYSITTSMKDGRFVEVATVGREGILGVNVFLGDPLGAGQTLLQVTEGDRSVLAMQVEAFLEESAQPGPFRDMVATYAQAVFLQSMQCSACNALHEVQQRCCRWLLQTHDRVEANDFLLKHEFLSIMLGVRRPTVTIVIGLLQQAGFITSKYGHIHIVNRAGLEAASCECYGVIRDHFTRLGIQPSEPKTQLSN